MEVPLGQDWFLRVDSPNTQLYGNKNTHKMHKKVNVYSFCVGRCESVSEPCVASHLLDVPVVELRRDLNPFCVFVHSEVEVRAAPLHCYMVPMLVI